MELVVETSANQSRGASVISSNPECLKNTMTSLDSVSTSAELPQLTSILPTPLLILPCFVQHFCHDDEKRLEAVKSDCRSRRFDWQSHDRKSLIFPGSL